MSAAQTYVILDIIRKRRLELNYSQEYVAAKLGIGQKTYSRLELGYIRLTVERFLQLSELTGLDPSELLRMGSAITPPGRTVTELR